MKTGGPVIEIYRKYTFGIQDPQSPCAGIDLPLQMMRNDHHAFPQFHTHKSFGGGGDVDPVYDPLASSRRKQGVPRVGSEHLMGKRHKKVRGGQFSERDGLQIAKTVMRRIREKGLLLIQKASLHSGRELIGKITWT